MDDKDLMREASSAREHAYAPYSKVMVGASVETDSGEIFSACNVENASYGLTICAERAAIFAAVARGHRKIKRVAIAPQGLKNPMPCGACLQVMNEFGVEKVLVGQPDGTINSYDLAQLLPRPFTL